MMGKKSVMKRVCGSRERWSISLRATENRRCQDSLFMVTSGCGGTFPNVPIRIGTSGNVPPRTASGQDAADDVAVVDLETLAAWHLQLGAIQSEQMQDRR